MHSIDILKHKRGINMDIVRAQDITVKFGGVVALNNVSLEMREGEILALIGPNGAGKTTLFNVITGFQSPTSGKIFYLDEELTGLPAYKVANKGLIRTFQKTMVFDSVSVEEGILIATHRTAKFNIWNALTHSKTFKKEEAQHRDEVEKILKFVGLYDRRKVIAGNLSYGEQRILEVALALAAKPEILLLDEPAAGLNSEESKDLISLIYKIRDMGLTILLVEHNMNIIMEISDRIVVLNQGNKIAEGTSEKIKNNKEVIKAYLGGE